MLTMKLYLILTALVASNAWGGPPTVPVSPPAEQQVHIAPQVQPVSHGASKGAAAPRQLTPEQRAELRRQIIQYSRPTKKKP
jgi:hypothetical protein